MITPPSRHGLGDSDMFIIADFSFIKYIKITEGKFCAFQLCNDILLYFIGLKAYNRYISNTLVMIQEIQEIG